MTDQLSRIAMLNDRCRLGLDRHARIVITATCLAALAGEAGLTGEMVAQAEAVAAIRRYIFKPEDGPERSRGKMMIRGRTVRFKIDYYDRSLEWGSEDPGDPLVTTRVVTIMLPGDD
jgi:hypothetical protein